MIVYFSIALLGVLAFLILFKSPHAVGLFVVLEFALPVEIYLTNTFSLTINRAIYLLAILYAVRKQIGSKPKKHPVGIWIMLFLFILLLFDSYANTITNYIQVGNSFYYFLTIVTPNFLLPGIILYYSVETKSDFFVLIKWLIVLIFIWTAYGIYEYVFRGNYFIDQLIREFPDRAASVVRGYNYSDINRFGSTQRIQATVWHPISFGGRISLIMGILLFCSSEYDFKSKKVFRNILGLTVLLIFICSLLSFSRSAWLFSAMTYILYFFYKSKNQKLKIGFMVGAVLIFICFFYSELQSMLFTNVKGSSLVMRLNQAKGVAKLIGNNFILGLGQQYAATYISKYGLYTDTFGFESFLFVTLLDSGLVGLTFYILFFYFIFNSKKTIRNINVKSAIKYISIPYITFIILTGEMQTLWLYWLCINIIFVADRIFGPSILVITEDLKSINAVKSTTA